MYDAAMLQSKDSIEELVTSGRVEVVVGHSAIELIQHWCQGKTGTPPSPPPKWGSRVPVLLV